MKKRNLVNILFVICIVGFVGFIAGIAMLGYLENASGAAPFGKETAFAILFISLIVCIGFGSIGYYLNSKPDKEIVDRMTSYSLYPEKKIEDYKGELATVRANYEADTSADKNVITNAHIMNNLKPYYDKKVLSSGNIYYGQIVEANSRLFDRTFKEIILPAVVIYSPDEYFESNPLALKRISESIYANKNNNILRNDRGVFFNIKLPDALTEGKTVYMTTLIIYRENLPLGYLSGSIFHVIADPEKSVAIFVVDAKYWTDDLIGNFVHGEI